MLPHFVSKEDLGLNDDKDDCPFRRNSAGFIQWSLQTPSGFPGKVLRSQEGEGRDFRASPCPPSPQG